MDRIRDILNSVNRTVSISAQKTDKEQKHRDLIDKGDIKNKAEGGDFTEVEDMETESPEVELMEYKYDFYNMSVGSLKAIATHANQILNSLDNPNIKENLTESWLQGKIAITEDYMRTIHDFIMYVSEAADTISAADKPGLWENIRKKKEREGKNIDQQNQETRTDQIQTNGKN